MSDELFLGFAAHAHTQNDVVSDPNLERQLRKKNSVEEASRLMEVVLDKIERDISNGGYSLKDVKLLVFFLSYRGDTEERDRLISETMLKTIENRFRGKTAAEQLRLIGHTTAGEIENQDLVLKEVSGIGYNGLSLLALIANLPIGIGRTQGLRTAAEATKQGMEMVRDAWIDIGHGGSKEHIKKRKVLFVLTKGASFGKAWNEYYMTDGIAEFISNTREARIANVMGGCSGDGIIGMSMHQYFGKLGGLSDLRILDNEAVCALMPLVDEPSICLDIAPVTKIHGPCTFNFDPDMEPKFKFVKQIGDEDPRKVFARVIFENEMRTARERGLPPPNEEELLRQISEIDGLPLNLTLAKYAFTFPFGNYAPMSVLKAQGSTLELLQPIRSHDPSIPGSIAIIEQKKVYRGAWNAFNMLRENRDFGENDTTFMVAGVTRRLSEIAAGCSINTEGQIFKEKLSLTQLIGFLAYGELSITNLLQEPYIFNCSCWGMTLRSKLGGRQSAEAAMACPEPAKVGAKGDLSFEFESAAAQKVFSYIIEAFVEDYMHRKMSLESSGWRTLTETIKHGGVPKSTVYNARGGMGSAISELENRGLLEVRVFPGERGRGGRILKVRPEYGKETIKRYIDQNVMKI
jgi:hypothetical protein